MQTSDATVIQQIIAPATMIPACGLLLLVVAVACNLLSVIGLAVRFVIEDASGTIHTGAVVVFIAGIVVMLGAMVTSFVEVKRITETVQYEHKRVEAICASDDADARSGLGTGCGEGTGL
jgi:hypothetical protein